MELYKYLNNEVQYDEINSLPTEINPKRLTITLGDDAIKAYTRIKKEIDSDLTPKNFVAQLNSIGYDCAKLDKRINNTDTEFIIIKMMNHLEIFAQNIYEYVSRLNMTTAFYTTPKSLKLTPADFYSHYYIYCGFHGFRRVTRSLVTIYLMENKNNLPFELIGDLPS